MADEPQRVHGGASLSHATHQITCVGALVGIAASLAGPLPARGAEVPFTEHVISTTADYAISVFATDLDGDGDTDVLSASVNDDTIAWYENNGKSPPTFILHVISNTADGAHSVFATDLDGDGDTDVLSASRFDNKIAWYESDGGSPPSFTEHVISTTAIDARSVFATDLDGDGDTDILSALEKNSNKIEWYENDGEPDPTFTEQTPPISATAFGAMSVFATDVDGDGDTDVLSASKTIDEIVWYANNGKLDPTFTEHLISGTANGAWSVFAADVDGDGDTDVLSASYLDNKIAWYESDGGSPPNFTEHLISSTADGAWSVFATDVDGDGDVDVLSASDQDDKIAWYENVGGSPPTFTEQTPPISSTADRAASVFATDVDGDGDTDVLSASLDDNKIAWYENTTPTCGNRAVRRGEECDDGNTEDADGCSATCTVESGYACVGEPSLCGLDCNENGIPDECDLACGLTDDPCDVDGCGESEDCDENAIPDECEFDCNENGLADECEVPASTGCPGGLCTVGCSQDIDQNCIPDECGACCTAQGCAQTTEALCAGPGKSKYNGDGTVCEQACPSGIPTVSQWGLVAMTLLVLAAGTVVLRRRRPVPG